VKCPEGCLHHERGSVFGTMVFAEESSICKAAIHAGFIKDHEGGEVIFVIANG